MNHQRAPTRTRHSTRRLGSLIEANSTSGSQSHVGCRERVSKLRTNLTQPLIIVGEGLGWDFKNLAVRRT